MNKFTPQNPIVQILINRDDACVVYAKTNVDPELKVEVVYSYDKVDKSLPFGVTLDYTLDHTPNAPITTDKQ